MDLHANTFRKLAGINKQQDCENFYENIEN